MAAYPQQINGSNSPVDIQSPGSYQALAYTLKSDCTQDGQRQEEFMDFYRTKVMAWLADNNTGYAYAWLVGTYLVVVGSPRAATLPWVGGYGIPGLTKYLTAEKPLPIQNLPSFVGQPVDL
jgi:hypothetical protein